VVVAGRVGEGDPDGLVLRFVHLDRNVHWVDEMATLRQTAGGD